jgi:hypothetical protein
VLVAVHHKDGPVWVRWTNHPHPWARVA